MAGADDSDKQSCKYQDSKLTEDWKKRQRTQCGSKFAIGSRRCGRRFGRRILNRTLRVWHFCRMILLVQSGSSRNVDSRQSGVAGGRSPYFPGPNSRRSERRGLSVRSGVDRHRSPHPCDPVSSAFTSAVCPEASATGDSPLSSSSAYGSRR